VRKFYGEGTPGKIYLSNIREVFLQSGQYISLNAPVFITSEEKIDVILEYEGETPAKKSVTCSVAGYREF
jgi:hypothetical protein